MFPDIKTTYAYVLANHLLEHRIANRSGESYFTHIEQGLKILEARNQPLSVMEAFCLHPLFQSDRDLVENFEHMDFNRFNGKALVYVFEYRAVANAGIRSEWNRTKKLRLSTLEGVNEMLVADKVQNYYSFAHYDRVYDEDAKNLKEYFMAWFHELGISLVVYDRLVQLIAEDK